MRDIRARRVAGRLAGILEAAVVRLGEDAADGLADLIVKLATVIEREAQVVDGQARAMAAARSIVEGTREMWREAPAAAVSRARCGALARAALVAVGEGTEANLSGVTPPPSRRVSPGGLTCSPPPPQAGKDK